MSAPTARSVDLRALGVARGAAREIEVALPPVELELGGEQYAVRPERPEATLRVTRSLSGVHARLRFDAELAGPCVRCLGAARVPLRVDAEEFAASDRPPDAEFDEDLDSDYIEDERLDLAGWARDALAEAVPPSVLCRADCAGLCPSCGADRNAGDCGCVEDTEDPRWAPLRELARRMGGDPPEGG